MIRLRRIPAPDLYKMRQGEMSFPYPTVDVRLSEHKIEPMVLEYWDGYSRCWRMVPFTQGVL